LLTTYLASRRHMPEVPIIRNNAIINPVSKFNLFYRR